MRKINESYLHEDTGITFDIEYIKEGTICHMPGSLVEFGHTCEKPSAETKKKVKIMPSAASGWVRGDKGFVFNRSKPEIIKKIGQALLDIGEFCEKL